MKVCQSAEKGGFNQFYFTKADGVTVAPKIAYSQIFEPWGWIVSTGNYVDDMNMEKEEMRAYLSGEYQSMLVRVGAVFVIALVIALITAYICGRAMVAPLKEIQQFAARISQGDLTTDVDVKYASAVGEYHRCVTGRKYGAGEI